jgi:hypothetical protein
MKTWLVLVVIIGVISTPLARAVCSEPQPRSVCAEYSASKAVVEATLLRVDNVLDRNAPEAVIARYFTLRVDRVFRGKVEKTVKMYESNDSGRASFDWKIGTKYILFLFDSREEKGLSLGGCGNSSPAAKASSVSGQLDQLGHQGRSALISGMVSVYNLSGPMPDIQVIARSGGALYKGLTDRKGRFKIEVPPGDYTVEPVQPPLSFQVFELSYEDPRHLTMQPGSCAQVQFIAASQR